MVEYIDQLISALGPLGLLVLGLAAMLEYVVPPFPGDTITLLGACTRCVVRSRGCSSSWW